jgi:L-ascorbate metabolism protein UlaG (beta-lactamase superfamily)
MQIQYYGHSCFKLTTKPAGRATEDITIFFDPFDKETGLRPPQGHADVVFVSHDHHDHNNVGALKDDPIIINTPGEYSVKGINVIGLDTAHDDQDGAIRGKNTIFVLETEELKICHLGDLGSELSGKQLEEIDGIDILMVPVGGKYSLDGKQAAELCRKIEPAIIIPIHYKLPASNMDVSDEKQFCNEIGSCPKETQAKITLKKKDLEGKHIDVLLMSPEA